jgi:hypothetical protein
MQTFLDNSMSLRARSEPTEININSVDCARPRAEIVDETRCSRVIARAKLNHFARSSGTPSSEAKRGPLAGNDLCARAQKPLVQNPPDREVQMVLLANAQDSQHKSRVCHS